MNLKNMVFEIKVEGKWTKINPDDIKEYLKYNLRF